MCKENRKYSLIDKKVYDWLLDVRKNDEHGFCIDKFNADFIVDDLTKYKVHDIVNIDGICIEITIKGKNCYPECPYYRRKNKSCLLKNGVSFGE